MKNEKPAATPAERRPWQPPTLTPAGTVSDVLRQGGGKVSTLSGDPGEPRKMPGTDR